MAFSTVPTHGKLGALYVLRPNGFSGIGLNDATWGTGSTAADLTYYEVEIDHVDASPDTFKWRVNGGAWTEDVGITGAAQVLADAQSITFAAIDGHTVGDRWVIGNLKDEATTENGTEAQITDATARLLNPNAPPVWTDDGGKVAQQVNYCEGKAIFSGNVGNVTVTGNNGFIPALALQKVGHLIDWSLNLTLDMADASRMGQQWKEALPGMAGGSGSANGYLIANQTLFNCLKESIESGEKYFLLQLFTWDAAQDQTGDHFNVWATFTSFGLNATIGEVVKEQVNFQITGGLALIADS